MQEHLGGLKGRTLLFAGDGNNVCHSLLLAAPKAGLNIRVASPEHFQPHHTVVAHARAQAIEYGTQVEIGTDALALAAGVDAVYTDVWVSMGQDGAKTAAGVFQPYQVNAELMRRANSHAIVLHCLPAHRGEEITGEVMDGPQSVVFDQAENRLHTQKAILSLLV
jgi:ornithine carbamoyltransferase